MRLSLFAVAAGAVIAGQAFAADVNTSFDVTARVVASCQVTASDIAFGDYDPVAATDLTAQGQVSVRCTRGTTSTVALDQGLSGTGTCAAPVREMAAGTERLAYGIYQDAALTTAWGCDAGNVQSVTTTVGPSTPVLLTTYGMVPAGQDAAMGDYQDTVQVTVTF